MSEQINDLEAYLGLPNGFFHKLQLEDDWTLVIKLFSLIESSCSSLLADEVGRPETIDAFSQVPMGTTKAGKLAFLQSLQLLSKQQLQFIQTLGELRNKFAHNVANTQKSLVQIIGTYNGDKKRQCFKTLGMGATVVFHGTEQTAADLAKEKPAMIIWVSAINLLEMIRFRMIAGKKRHEIVTEMISERVSIHGPIVIKPDTGRLS